MVYSDELTLKDAAAFAGVTEATMRVWVKSISGVSRVPGGGYRIPRTELQTFIVAKNARSLTGASSASKAKGEGRGEEKILASLEGENERLRLDLAERTREIRELREDLRRAQADLKDSQNEIRRLEAELRAHLAGGVVSGVSRWIKSKLV